MNIFPRKTFSPFLFSKAIQKLQNRTKYTLALTRQVPPTLSQALTSATTLSSSSSISFARAQEQHDNYISTLRSILPTLTLSQNPSQPDCVFIEDTAIVIGYHAVINRIGAPSRQGEVNAIKDILIQFGLTVHDMRDSTRYEDATCDGGDVLYSGGDHLFVGLSSRTNEAGIQFLQDSFLSTMGVKVIPVPLLALKESFPSMNALHLKSIVTHIDDKTLIIPRGQLGNEIFQLMGAERRGYTSIQVPDATCSNVVSVNGLVLVPPTKCEETELILEREIVKKRRMKVDFVDASEFAKCDGALTCKSILLNL